MNLLPSPLDPGFLICFAALGSLTLVCWVCGRLLLPRWMNHGDWMEALFLRLAVGMILVTAIAAIICLGRLSYVVLLLPVMLGIGLWLCRQHAAEEKLPTPDAPRHQPLIWLLVLALGCTAFEWWNTGWVGLDGKVTVIHLDYGFYANLAHGLGEARVADAWCVTMGEHARELEGVRDAWYHWGPVWLAGAIHQITGLMPLAALMHVVNSFMDMLLILALAAITRRLTSMTPGRVLMIAVAAFFGVQLLRYLGKEWFALNPKAGSLHLLRFNLAYTFSYKHEAIIVLGALLAWLRGEGRFAIALMICAAICSPHVVAAGGVTAGMLLLIGAARRDASQGKMAGTLIAALLFTWASLHLVFGARLPKAEGQSLVKFDFDHLLDTAWLGTQDFCTALVLGILSVPGIWHLLRGKDPRSTAQSRTLGWMALGGMAGSFYGYRLLDGVADNMHMVLFPHAVLIMPAGIWGLARLASATQLALWQRSLSVLAIVLSAVMGLADLAQARDAYQRPWKVSEMEQMKKALGGRAAGYFSKSDGTWWISDHSSLAAMLEARLVRLVPLAGELKGTNKFARFYGALRPYELVPPAPGEASEAWALRFAEHIGVQCFFEIAGEKLPSSIKAQAREVTRIPGLVLYEWIKTPPAGGQTPPP
jgi:hypothetical protein